MSTRYVVMDMCMYKHVHLYHSASHTDQPVNITSQLATPTNDNLRHRTYGLNSSSRWHKNCHWTHQMYNEKHCDKPLMGKSLNHKTFCLFSASSVYLFICIYKCEYLGLSVGGGWVCERWWSGCSHASCAAVLVSFSDVIVWLHLNCCWHVL